MIIRLSDINSMVYNAGDAILLSLKALRCKFCSDILVAYHTYCSNLARSSNFRNLLLRR